MSEETGLKPTGLPMYEIKRIGQEEFICIRKTDTVTSNFHILDNHGNNYGAWQSVENFVECRKALVKNLRKPSDLPTADPIGVARLSVKTY